ncbi:RagB/SusD family nutrient uptake outer membrane protein [Flavobacterium silvisoli]|uniref:RagB/SusD family nutrient uptake outer membrane protein n=1 Tax=Flavobacterium silvisoli TaxID=2529433 RepID=A0A4V2L4A9_9FLAO|nr:RagB/SusD family nutrient uptake outer membrane protein [Flavobacterium silvisoli]TBX65963.1 RagB/SusD family nutrient uptake outer membrane protein [Flavobacterium silvisoli]
MKKILSILSLASILFTTSCDDNLLEAYAPGYLTEEEAIKTPDDLTRLMNTAYGVLSPGSEIEFSSAFTDEVGVGYNTGGQGKDTYLAFLMNPSLDAPNGIWDTHYAALAYANRVIKFSENLTAADADEQQVINSAVAQALAIRAYCHMQLIAYFSTNPKDRNALGVMMSNDVYPSNALKPRETNGVLYDFIDADLAKAVDLFNTLTTSPSNLYANKYFAKAMQARVNAMRGDYANALVFANDVIANSGVSLASFARYKNVFHTDDNTAAEEVLFKLKRNKDEARTGALWASVNTSVTGSPFYEVGRSLFNLMNTTSFASASTVTITAITGSTITAPGNSLMVGDMFTFNNSYPANAAMNSNGLTTVPLNAIVAGKVYYVKTIINAATGTFNLTTDPTLASPPTVLFTAANSATFPITAKANYGDIRYSVNIHPTSIINPNYQTVVDYLYTDKITTRKYPGRTDSGNFVNDIKISRLSEMYFIKAEALASAGDLAGAAAAIKVVRDARANRPQPLPVYADATAAFKDILKERRIEFAFEGYRFVDLKRIGALAGEGISRDARDCEFNGACTLPVSDYRFALPMPQDETNVNQSVKDNQNPGY